MTNFQAADFYQLDELLTAAERKLRDEVRQWVQTRFLPIVAQHYRDGTFPLELMPELAALGVFGPGIEGYGCAGLGNIASGIIMRELERGDSGLRTFASVQGSLAMMAIYLFGSEEQKTRWLPAMAKGEKLGCFALTEPDFGSNPGGMQCRARKTADGYRLTGMRSWNSMIAQYRPAHFFREAAACDRHYNVSTTRAMASRGGPSALPWRVTTKRANTRRAGFNSVAPSAVSNSCKQSSRACSPRSPKRNCSRCGSRS